MAFGTVVKRTRTTIANKIELRETFMAIPIELLLPTVAILPLRLHIAEPATNARSVAPAPMSAERQESECRYPEPQGSWLRLPSSGIGRERWRLVRTG